MTFQALSSTFTNQGNCHAANWWLSFVLVALLTLSCIFFAFTDSFVVDAKRRYGIIMPGRLHLLNLSAAEERTLRHYAVALKRLRAKSADYMRAFLTVAVFLSFVAGEVGMQKCFFPQAEADADTKELLRNVPLGVAVFSSVMFALFPSTRKGIDLLSGSALLSLPLPGTMLSLIMSLPPPEATNSPLPIVSPRQWPSLGL